MYIALCDKIEWLTDKLASSGDETKKLDKKLEDCEKENTALEKKNEELLQEIDSLTPSMS